MKTELHGLIPAVHTPMRPDGSLDLESVPHHVEFILEAGVNGLFVCGTTGEFPSLTVQERRAVAEAFVRAVGGRLPVIVHVGHNCLESARELASHAAKIGAAAIAAVPPSYFKPASIYGLVDCCAEIAQGAPHLPFFYYHIPHLTGVTVSIIDLLTQALERLPSMAGVKYSSPKVDEFSACVDRFNGRFTMMFGRDQMLLSALSAGASAAVGSTYNYAAPLYRKLWNAFETGDMATARLCQHRAVRFIEILAAFGGVRASKVFMKLSGVDVGPPRLPLQPLSSDEERSLGQRLEEIGFFEWRTG